MTFAVAAWVFILAFTGVFQLFRGAIADGVVFEVLAAGLLADAAGWLPALRERRPPRFVIVITLAVAAAVLALTPRHGIADGIVLAVAGLLVLAVAWPNHPGRAEKSAEAASRWSPRLKRSAALWASLGLAFCLWELTMYLLGTYLPGGRDDFPALSDLLDPLLASPIGRILFAAGWLLGGVALLRRGRNP